jgi:hypothetical protein
MRHLISIMEQVQPHGPTFLRPELHLPTCELGLHRVGNTIRSGDILSSTPRNPTNHHFPRFNEQLAMGRDIAKGVTAIPSGKRGELPRNKIILPTGPSDLACTGAERRSHYQTIFLCFLEPNPSILEPKRAESLKNNHMTYPPTPSLAN